jgi:hypothetical protein
VGMADADVTAIYAIALNGEAFEINGLEIQLDNKLSPKAPGEGSKFSPPSGVGKIRLVTVNGEQA